MLILPASFAPLRAYPQFILYKLIPKPTGKTQKLPINPHTLEPFTKDINWQHDPTQWTDADSAIAIANTCGPSYGVGFLFRSEDPFFFLDIDNAWDGEKWSPVALSLCQQFAGAAIEVSQSGTGLHIFGTGIIPPHGCKNSALGLELYHESRFAALTGTNVTGSISQDCSSALAATVAGYFPESAPIEPTEWTSAPVESWHGPADDDELIAKMINAKSSAAATLGHAASFMDLWTNNEPVLAAAYPDIAGQQLRAYDASQADAALAQHLAFWTGKDCERILRLMQLSALAREKWEREDYLYRTILRAVGLQKEVYSDNRTTDSSQVDELGAPKLRASSEAQRNYAEAIRATVVAQCADNRDLAERLVHGVISAKFWIDNKDKTPEELAVLITPISSTLDPFSNSSEPQRVEGFQFMSADLQIDWFRGCAYVQDAHCIFTPTGECLKEGQFNATYGGYTFQMDARDKVTQQAWDAFTRSQIIRFPKAKSTCFRPELEPGSITKIDGRQMVNTYVPINVPRIAGDPAPFLEHLNKILPDRRDQQILLSYMAACVQYPGVKFQWAPLIQGAEGNGKTLFSRCITAALGEKYTHMPPISEIGEKHNDWLFGKLFIGVEDVFVPVHKQEIIEIIKPMITNERLSKRAMQRSQVMDDNRANFLLNSNHKNAWRKTENDRRIAMFFTRQQSATDCLRDGMGADYFPRLYNWLKGEGEFVSYGAGYGYAVVTNYLMTYEIQSEFNPAGLCHRAPKTSSTAEAIKTSLGPVEQEILEAIEEDRPGFSGGWISSNALDLLLKSMRMARTIPPNRRRDLLVSLGYDWHPGLTDGRVSGRTVTDGGRPRLYIKDGHIHRNLTLPGEIVRHYDEAQQGGAQSEAAKVFAS